jgi:hypothetical protein
MKNEEEFEVFLGRLQLGRVQVERMNSAWRAISDGLRGHFGLPPEDVFLQGSYANNSAIKPPPDSKDGEYDIDLIASCARADEEPVQALNRLAEALSAIGYGENVEPDPERKRPCIRLRYADDDAGRFHVDVTPARELGSDGVLYEIPRPAEGWRETAPQAYAAWCTEQGEEFLRTVQELKRWRDECQEARQAIKSIVLQVLISHHMPHGVGDADRIARTLRGIAAAVAASPGKPLTVINPVLKSENLTATWPLDAYTNFIEVVEQAAALAEKTLAEPSESQSRSLWCELLGSDFPDHPTGGGRTPPPPVPSGRRSHQSAPRNEWA